MLLSPRSYFLTQFRQISEQCVVWTVPSLFGWSLRYFCSTCKTNAHFLLFTTQTIAS